MSSLGCMCISAQIEQHIDTAALSLMWQLDAPRPGTAAAVARSGNRPMSRAVNGGASSSLGDSGTLSSSTAAAAEGVFPPLSSIFPVGNIGFGADKSTGGRASSLGSVAPNSVQPTGRDSGGGFRTEGRVSQLGIWPGVPSYAAGAGEGIVAVDTYFSGVLIPKELSRMYETIFAMACSPGVALLAQRMPRTRINESARIDAESAPSGTPGG
jgi:hypothetical protein